MLGDVVVRTHVRTYAPANHAASHDDHEKSNAWFSYFCICIMVMGLRSAALRADIKEPRYYDKYKRKKCPNGKV